MKIGDEVKKCEISSAINNSKNSDSIRKTDDERDISMI